MPQPLEPTLASLPSPVLRYFAATRPAFLSVTFVGVLLGLASAAASGAHLDPATATLTMFFALVAHAGANVVNDYYDSLSGCDAVNTGRVFPFTGGSRFIQNGVLSQHTVGRYGYSLLAAVIPAAPQPSPPVLTGQAAAGGPLVVTFSSPARPLLRRTEGSVPRKAPKAKAHPKPKTKAVSGEAPTKASTKASSAKPGQKQKATTSAAKASWDRGDRERHEASSTRCGDQLWSLTKHRYRFGHLAAKRLSQVRRYVSPALRRLEAVRTQRGQAQCIVSAANRTELKPEGG